MAQAPDLSDLFGKQSTPSTPNTGSSPIGDLFGGPPSSVQNTPPTEPVSPSSSSIGDLFGTPSPNNGQTTSEAPKFDYQDPNKSWYSRAWSWLNTPLTESLFGLPEDRPGAGGFERGLEHIVSGLTSPLSGALGLATFGTGGFIEGAGASALREAGLSAPEIADVIKGSQVAVNTFKEVPEGATAIEDAVKASGVDPALWKRGQSILYDNGLTEHDLLQGNMVERGAFQILRNTVPDLPIAATARAAKTANSLLNAGFTYQQLESAAAMAPRFLDALKEGDYDKAAEYGTEAIASGGLGVLGASHALHSAGELFKPLLETDKFRPNDEWLAIDRVNKEREAQHATAEQQAINLDKATREILGHAGPGALQQIFGESPEAKAAKNLDLASVFHQVVTGGDKVKAAQWYNALSEALGRDDRLPIPRGELLDSASIPRGQTHVVPEGSNTAGEVRVGADGRPVVWLSPHAWSEFATTTGTVGSGISYSFPEAEQVAAKLHPDSPVSELFAKAREYSHLTAVAKSPEVDPNFTVRVAAEELHHTWQRELSQAGDIRTHLDQPQWDRLSGIIPAGQTSYLDNLEYEKDPVTRVAETAAKFRTGLIPEAVSDEDAAHWLNEYYKEVEAKHGPQSPDEANRINDIARQHVEDIYADRETANRSADQEAGNNVLGGVQEGSGRPAGVGQEEPPKGLSARELTPDESEYGLLGFVSPNVRRLGSVDEAQNRLSSRSQRIAERLSPDFARAIGVRAVSRPAIGHWEGGAENSLIHRYALGTDPDAVEYHNSFVAKAGYQNAGGGFIPGTGNDVLFQFRVPGKFSINDIANVLEAHGIPGDTIEPVEGGHVVHVVSENGTLKPQVGEIASRLEAGRVSQTYGKQFFNGDYNSRDAAQIAFDNKLTGIEAKHPEWRGVRNAFESSPDFVELQRYTRTPEVTGVHGTRQADLTNVSPEKQFTGPQKGAEQARARKFSEDWIPRSYWRVDGSHGEPFYNKQPYQYEHQFDSENLYNYVLDPDRLQQKALEEAQKRGIQNQPGAIGTIYERMMKSAGYDGYYHPGAQEIGVFKDTPVEAQLKDGTSPLTGQGLASRERTWTYIKKLLPDEAATHDTGEKRDMLVDAFNMMPDKEENLAAIRAGRAGQLWYERSSRAFDALLDSGADFIKPKDKTKFLNFVAALSPVQPVRQNLLMALNLWYKWDKAGRPTDVEWDGTKVANKNASLFRILKGRGQTQGVDLPARMGNAIRALQGEPLSGPKVSAFTTNLGENSNRVTNDTWMAVLAGQDPNRISKPQIYDAMTAKIREAAREEGIAPRQAQAAAWSFIKSLAELSGWGNDRWIPPQEIIKQGLFTPELVATHSSDFADLLQNDPEIRAAFKNIGGDLNALDTKLKSYVPAKPIEGQAAEPSAELHAAAGRLEAARSNARIANHLARKTEPGLFDNTEFSPNNGLFSRERPKNGLPDNLDEMIRSNVFKNQPKEYQDLVMESLRRVAEGSLSEKELAASKFVRDEQDRNFEIGSSNDILHHYIEDYMTRVYQDTNPQGKVITSDAKGGKFATNVSMAKQRVYDSNLTALLKSPKKMELDPAKITARGRAMLIKAAANKQLIDTLRDNFTRASDGRPAVVLSGSGQVVSGPNGEDPKTFIDPSRVRKINIAPGVVDQLSKSGDLQRFLDEGTIKDITPYVRPNNIEAAISRMEDQGTRQNAQYDEVGNNKLRTDLMYLKSMLANKDFSGLKDFNDKLERQYAWDPQDYITLDKQAMKGWNFITNDSSGHSVFVRSDILAHPEFAQYLKDRLGLEPSDIAKHPIGKALLGAGTRLKQTLLSLSPFHMVQEALRAVMVGVNPFHITGPDILNGEKIDPNDPFSPTIIRKAVEHGFTTGTDYSALQEHSEGLAAGGGGLIAKIPGVGKVLSNSLDWYQNFLFKRYIPALKARSVELMYHEYQNAHPEWSVDKVAKAAALHTNDTFGGINWKAMGRSATTQDWGRLLLLAPDWLEAEMRSGARLFNKDEGGLGRAQVAKMAIGLWGVARVLNYITTGSFHNEAPFGLAVKNKEGKETVFGIRTLPTDLLHAASDPVGFIQGRLSPVIRTGAEVASGRDVLGRKLQPSDLWADVFRNMAPIPLQSIGQAVSDTGPQIGNVGQGWKAVGGTAQTYSTPAQKYAADQASSHSEDGPLDPAAMARHHRVIQLEDQARAGEISWPDLYKLTYATDQLKESELKKIQDNVKSTQGMSSDMASLYSRASRLPASEYLQLLDVANPSERTALIPLTQKVQKRYLTKAKKDETPDERDKDPVFQRFLRMIPGQTQQSAPQPQSFVAPPSSVPIPPAVQKEAAYLYTATHPLTGHRVGSNDGQNWVDHQTGAPVNG